MEKVPPSGLDLGGGTFDFGHPRSAFGFVALRNRSLSRVKRLRDVGTNQGTPLHSPALLPQTADALSKSADAPTQTADAFPQTAGAFTQ